MSWHYRLRKRSYNGEVYYDIVEYYPDRHLWTVDGIGPAAESKAGLLKVLDDMRKDVLQYPELDESGEGEIINVPKLEP
jgi:hypothetical protein